MFLTEAEIEQLTGYAYPKHQARWLRSRRIKHHMNGKGRIVVRWSWVDGGKESAPVEPDWEAVT